MRNQRMELLACNKTIENIPKIKAQLICQDMLYQINGTPIECKEICEERIVFYCKILSDAICKRILNVVGTKTEMYEYIFLMCKTYCNKYGASPLDQYLQAFAVKQLEYHNGKQTDLDALLIS